MNSRQRLIKIEELQNLRRQLIAFLNLLDDLLGFERTIPTKDERHLLREVKQKSNG